MVERERALELLACSDVCVSPHVPNPDGTPFFGSPTKLFEYMGLGKAIVASDLDQIGEVIEHERSGLLCPPGDVDAAAAAIRRLLADARTPRAARGGSARASPQPLQLVGARAADPGCTRRDSRRRLPTIQLIA